MIALNGFTATENRIVELLSDGRPHRREEIHALLSDNLAALPAIQVHISNIRKKIKLRGEDILCTLVNRQIHYQHVVLLYSGNDGRT